MADRIFIVEDHPKMRETYTLFIGITPDLEICGISATAAEALVEIPQQKPDLVIVDISLPDADGFELTRQLRELYPTLPILIVSGHLASDFGEALNESGANGYVNKRQAYSTLVPTIREILNGR